jgi:hypothetical protein
MQMWIIKVCPFLYLLLPSVAAYSEVLPQIEIEADTGWIYFDRYNPPYGTPGSYRYGPSLMAYGDGTVDCWTCAPGIFPPPPDPMDEEWDWIRMRRSYNDGLSWGGEYTALRPSDGQLDHFSVCDPGVVRIGSYYYIAYTSLTDHNIDGDLSGEANDVYVARGAYPWGPFQKWSGSNWGTTPQPIIEYLDNPVQAFGVGEPSLVVKDDTLYVYYAYWGRTAGGVAVNETRVATAPANDLNWPAQLTQVGTAFTRPGGEDSTDVKYLPALDLFMGLGVANRLTSSSYLHLWISKDGLTFEPAGQITGPIQDWAHNAGWVGDELGHIDITHENLFVAYAYSPDDDFSWANWNTFINPIAITAYAAMDFDKDEDVDQRDFGFMQKCVTDGLQSIPAGCEPADLNGDGLVASQDVAIFLDCVSGPNQTADVLCGNN